jgi:integrase
MSEISDKSQFVVSSRLEDRRGQSLNKGGTMPEQMRRRGKSGIWYAACQFMGVRLDDSLGTSDRRWAERELEKLKSKIEKGEYLVWKKSFDELAEEYMRDVLPEKSKHSQERYSPIVRLHLLSYFGGMRASDITDYEAFKYVQGREKSKTPESSLKKELRVLKDIMRLGDRSWKLPSITFKYRGKRVTNFLREDDLSKIIGFLEDHHKPVAMIASYTGLRLGNVINLRWCEVDLFGGWVKVEHTKNGEAIKIPICAKLYEVFKSLNKIRNIRGEGVFDFTIQAFQKAWKRARAKAGFEWARPHDMRHFFCSYLINQGVDHLTVAQLSGHKTLKVLQERYAHFEDRTLKSAVSVFDSGDDSAAEFGKSLANL